MRKKKMNHQKRVERFIKGSFYKFDVRDPLGERPLITNTDYGHKNAFNYPLMKGNLTTLKNIFDSRRLKWKSEITVEFQDQNGKRYDRIGEIVWFGLLRDCENEYQQCIEDIFEVSNMDHYKICHVTAEVLGVEQIKESDFNISKEEAMK